MHNQIVVIIHREHKQWTILSVWSRFERCVKHQGFDSRLNVNKAVVACFNGAFLVILLLFFSLIMNFTNKIVVKQMPLLLSAPCTACRVHLSGSWWRSHANQVRKSKNKTFYCKNFGLIFMMMLDRFWMPMTHNAIQFVRIQRQHPQVWDIIKEFALEIDFILLMKCEMQTHMLRNDIQWILSTQQVFGDRKWGNGKWHLKFIYRIPVDIHVPGSVRFWLIKKCWKW